MKKIFIYVATIVLSFVLNVNSVFAAFSSNTKVEACGFSKMPSNLPQFTSGLFNIIKIAVPVLLIIMVIVDLLSAIMSSDDEGFKKSRKKIITRALAAIVVFFVMSVIQLIFKKIDSNDATGITNCMNCILNNECIVVATSDSDEQPEISETGIRPAGNNNGVDSSWWSKINEIINKTKPENQPENQDNQQNQDNNSQNQDNQQTDEEKKKQRQEEIRKQREEERKKKEEEKRKKQEEQKKKEEEKRKKQEEQKKQEQENHNDEKNIECADYTRENCNGSFNSKKERCIYSVSKNKCIVITVEATK